MKPADRQPKPAEGPLDEAVYALAAALIWAAVLYGLLAPPTAGADRSRTLTVAACP